MSSDENSNTVFATLLQLIRRTREATSIEELCFQLVNETYSLVPYRQAALWFPDKGVVSLSGVSRLEKQAPFLHWLQEYFKENSGLEVSKSVDLSLLDVKKHPEIEHWDDWLPPLMLLVPVSNGGCLMLASTAEIGADEQRVLEEWVEAWCNQYQLMLPQKWKKNFFLTKKSDGLWPKTKYAVLLLLVVVLAVVPVRLSVLAPAELVPLNPAIIRAPMDGVIEVIAVEPNQVVDKDQLLFEFDRVSLASQLTVAERELATRQAEYRQEVQRSLIDQDSKSRLAVLQSQIREKTVNVSYLEELNNRSAVTASRGGIVLFGDATEMIGQPVSTGERVMIVAGETDVQIEAWVSPADLVEFPAESRITIYLAADPLSPLVGTINYVAHQAELRPQGHFAYRVRAQLDSSNTLMPRVGLKGTAKLDGAYTPLIYWVFRKPWAAFRGWLGL